jgi:hypothetical protein
VRTTLFTSGALLLVCASGAFAYSFIGDKWLDPRHPVEYQFNTVLNEQCIAGLDELDEVRAAFAVWAAVPTVSLTFGEQGSTTTQCGLVADGDNTISMEDCNNQCTGSCIAVTSSVDWGNGGDPTWAFDGATPLQQRGKNESDITFSKGWRFGTFADVGAGCTSDACPAGNTFDIRGIAVHEIGHFIGLGHSTVGGATMFASASFCTTSLTSLAPDDEAGVTVLYDSDYVPFDFVDVVGGNVRCSLFNAGNFGYSGSGGPVGGNYGSGFEFPLGTQNLYEGALIYGIDGASIVQSDFRQPGSFGQDNDFFQTSVVDGGGAGASTTFNDDRGDAGGLGIDVTAVMTASSDPANEDFVIICYRLTNTTGSSITGLRVGIIMDIDFAGQAATNSLVWDATNEVGVLTDPSTANQMGLAVLNSEGAQTFRGLAASANFSESSKATYLFDDFNNTDVLNNDVNALIATGDYTIPAGGTAIASFVLAGGSGSADLLANIAQARSIYSTGDHCAITVDVADVHTPRPMHLGQNVPNPFNPQTTISFELDRAGMVLLEVFDTSGRSVRTLVRGVRTPGGHEVRWDGKDDLGKDLPSGMYLYTLRTSAGTTSRKMMLLK